MDGYSLRRFVTIQDISYSDTTAKTALVSLPHVSLENWAIDFTQHQPILLCDHNLKLVRRARHCVDLGTVRVNSKSDHVVPSV